MKKLTYSGLPIAYNEETVRLFFSEGLTCAGDGGKDASALKGLLYREDGDIGNVHCYDFYRDIVFEEHRALFKNYDYRYDITVIMPGTVNDECKKTSGHYHGYIDGQSFTYPEVYEVLSGEAVYILQKVHNFDKENEEPVIEAIKAVRVKAGQAIIIPPFWGHCSVNAGEGPLIFSNIAVVSCPMHYEPIKQKHGLGAYVLKENGHIKFVKNSHYVNIPEINEIAPQQNSAMGITFGKSVYWEFIHAPEKFDFLLRPEAFIEAMEAMTK